VAWGWEEENWGKDEVIPQNVTGGTEGLERYNSTTFKLSTLDRGR